MKKLARLHLNNNNLRGLIPAQIGLLSSLTELYFGYNDLSGEIPATLGNCIAIRMLHLNDNSITGHGERAHRSIFKCNGSFIFLSLV